MTSYRIRAADTGDLAWLARCNAAMALETEDKPLDAVTLHAGIASALADGGKARYFIAMRDAALAGAETIGMPVGTLMLTTEWSDWRNGDWWWIQSVYVMPEYRRQGIYAALHGHVERLAREADGVIGLRLYVETENADAMATYAAMGMRDAGYRVFEAEFVKGV
ncbi:MAG: GNAT family N-acetyltransferase [Pseudomonadota bacterium]|nr:GNAT family N-acetyltransferase [Pseudomonadota bacterium]